MIFLLFLHQSDGCLGLLMQIDTKAPTNYSANLSISA